jgi:TM2 domain-containing membrane protein YozV
MSLKWIIRFTLSLSGLCASLWGKAQSNHQFLTHLYHNKLEREIYRYLQKTESNQDTLHYQLMKYSVIFNHDTMLLDLAGKTKSLNLHDTLLNRNISLKILVKGDNTLKRFWFDTLLKNDSDAELKELWRVSENPNTTGESLHINSYSDSYRKYKKSFNKKPFVAGALSAAVPGLGKLYIGKPYAALGVFLGNAIQIGETAEAIKVLGVNTAFSIFDISVASLYYLANIAGSYYDCKVAKKMKKINFINDANLFYRDYFNFSGR